MSFITPDIGDIVRNKIDHERYGYKYTGIVIDCAPALDKVKVMWVMDDFEENSVIVDWNYRNKLKVVELNDD